MIEAIKKLSASGSVTLTFDAIDGDRMRVLVRQIPNKAITAPSEVHLPPFTVTGSTETVMCEVEKTLAELSNYITTDINATIARVKADLDEQVKAAVETAAAANKRANKPAAGKNVTVTPKPAGDKPPITFAEEGDDEEGDATTAPAPQSNPPSLFE